MLCSDVLTQAVHSHASNHVLFVWLPQPPQKCLVIRKLKRNCSSAINILFFLKCDSYQPIQLAINEGNMALMTHSNTMGYYKTISQAALLKQKSFHISLLYGMIKFNAWVKVVLHLKMSQLSFRVMTNSVPTNTTDQLCWLNWIQPAFLWKAVSVFKVPVL